MIHRRLHRSESLRGISFHLCAGRSAGCGIFPARTDPGAKKASAGKLAGTRAPPFIESKAPISARLWLGLDVPDPVTPAPGKIAEALGGGGVPGRIDWLLILAGLAIQVSFAPGSLHHQLGPTRAASYPWKRPG